MTRMLRVVIAEDHYLVREGTRRLLESGDINVVAAVSDAVELIAATERLRPDAVITDIRMPPGHHIDGIDAAHTIRSRHPSTGVVVLSQYASPLYAFTLFEHGTTGRAYLLKDRIGDRDELVGAIRAVAAGGSVIDPLIVEKLLARGSTTGPTTALTARERDVLAHMAQGRSNRAIATHLHMSLSSVEKHVNSVFTKFGLDRSDTSVNRRVAAVLAFVQAQSSLPH
jgi:DNA-binding NarL/FixJ family response regulator